MKSQQPPLPLTDDRPGIRDRHTKSPARRLPATVFDTPRAAFYDGRWPEPDYSAGSFRNWLVRKQRFFLRRLPRAGSATVLDLGCGGGWKLLTRAGRVFGIDVSPRSLQGARSLYYGATAGDLGYLPYRDASFDLVVSSDVLGHVPVERKPQVIAEIYRVLKPRGRTIHYIETEGEDPLTRFAKRYERLYRDYVVGPEGHEGLESPEATFRRFRRAGFQPVYEGSCYRMVMYTGRVVQLFDNEYVHQSLSLRGLVMLCKLMTRNHVLEMASNVGVALLLELTDRLLPESWGSGVLVEYGKGRPA